MRYWNDVESPVGPLRLVGDDDALLAIHFLAAGRRSSLPAARRSDHAPVIQSATAQLAEYFARTRREFDVPLAQTGTPFQRSVWAILKTIPYGTTTTYGQVAARIGRPRGSRAVGLANGANPIPIIVPCHRVIGADGTLTGFGGGLAIKRELLRLEGAECGANIPEARQQGRPVALMRRVIL